MLGAPHHLRPAMQEQHGGVGSIVDTCGGINLLRRVKLPEAAERCVQAA